MNSIDKAVASIARDIERQAKRLVLYQDMSIVFQGIKIPEGTNLYFNRYESGDVYADFTASYSEDGNKDLRPMVHAMARKFHAKFKKGKSYGGDSISFKSEVYTEINGRMQKMDLTISGVVPGTCKIVETKIPLTEEEIEAARQAALAGVKTERVERTIVCGK